jgi:hypothetical protein
MKSLLLQFKNIQKSLTLRPQTPVQIDRDDWDAIGSDFSAVGRHIESAMNQFRTENQRKKQSA